MYIQDGANEGATRSAGDGNTWTVFTQYSGTTYAEDVVLSPDGGDRGSAGGPITPVDVGSLGV